MSSWFAVPGSRGWSGREILESGKEASEMVKRFEDLRVWQEARQLNRVVFEMSGRLIERKRFSLENQITRASLSVMNNIAEGFDRGGNNEFHHFLIQAKGSVGEVKSMLYVLLDDGFVEETEFQSLYERCDKLGRGLHRLIQHVGNSDFSGVNRRNGQTVRESEADYMILPDPKQLNRLWPE